MRVFSQRGALSQEIFHVLLVAVPLCIVLRAGMAMRTTRSYCTFGSALIADSCPIAATAAWPPPRKRIN